MGGVVLISGCYKVNVSETQASQALKSWSEAHCS